MYKLKLSFALLLLFVSFGLTAQTIQDGKKFHYQQRHQSAKESLVKALAAAPTNPELIYWLAQVHFDMKDVSGAKDVLRKGMEGANGSNPLLMVASGQAELVENKPNDARQRFETAISLTKGKDILVYTAIGKANLEEGGDPAYGIEKLKAATLVKNFKDPMVHVYMGDLYRKLNEGGAAVSSYENALLIDPKLSIAKHKIGKIYLTQGSEQRDIFLGKFKEAVTDDQTFTPALYDLYVYYFSRDVNEAKKYFELYKANTDRGPALDYEEVSLQFAAGDFKSAISKADALLQTQGANADARLYRLKGYCCDKMGDSIQALSFLEIFFQKAALNQINSDNYVVAAYSAAKQKAEPAKIEYYFTKSIETDTTLSNKIDYARKAADFFKKSGNPGKSAEWLTKILRINPKLSNVDLYNAGFENFKASQFQTADSIFSIYKTQFPNEVYGHYWSFRCRSVIDSTMETGLAIPDCEKFISIAELDKVKNKSTLTTAYGYLAGYSANIKKDLATAKTYLEKIIEIDPTNQDAIKNKDILDKALAPKK